MKKVIFAAAVLLYFTTAAGAPVAGKGFVVTFSAEVFTIDQERAEALRVRLLNAAAGWDKSLGTVNVRQIQATTTYGPTGVHAYLCIGPVPADKIYRVAEVFIGHCSRESIQHVDVTATPWK